MCERYLKNRASLMSLMYRMNAFTEDDLVNRFSTERRGDIVIDGRQSIGTYLRDLAEFGILDYEYGKYSVTKK